MIKYNVGRTIHFSASGHGHQLFQGTSLYHEAPDTGVGTDAHWDEYEETCIKGALYSYDQRTSPARWDRWEDA